MISIISFNSPTTQQLLEPANLRTVGEPEISLSHKDPSLSRETYRPQPQPILHIISFVQNLSIRGNHATTLVETLTLININYLKNTVYSLTAQGCA